MGQLSPGHGPPAGSDAAVGSQPDMVPVIGLAEPHPAPSAKPVGLSREGLHASYRQRESCNLGKVRKPETPLVFTRALLWKPSTGPLDVAPREQGARPNGDAAVASSS